jgi:hypothetical protein
MIRKILASLIFILSISCFAVTIESFHSDVTLTESGELIIKETIAVNFGGDSYHGIYRDIPLKYKRNALNYKVRFKNESVTNEKGEALRYKVEKPDMFSGSIRLKIGDPDITINGLNIYVIKYRMQRAINFFDDSGTEKPKSILLPQGYVWSWAINLNKPDNTPAPKSLTKSVKD